jgi:transposase
MGYLAGFWTIPLLLVYLFNQFSLVLSHTTVRNILYELDYRCRRPRLAASKIDELASSKMAAINEAFNNLNNDSVILYQDETTFRLLPLVRRMWMKLNEQVRIITPSGWNRRFSVFGALNAKSGKFSYEFFDRAISINFITFLEQLLKEYPNKIIFLILDNATYHTSHMVKDWSKNHPEIKFLWLPKNNPQLNPVEKIWWRMKDIVSANRSYKGLKIMKQKCIEFLTNLTSEAAIQLASLSA